MTSKQEEVDDSDLDDLLDDVLDDYGDLSIHGEKPATSTETKTATVKDVPSDSLDDVLDSDDLAKQLELGMEELMSKMNEDDDMKQAFEKVWGSLDLNTTEGKSKSESLPSEASSQSSRPEVPTTPKSFQETIAQTMNKLKDSSKQVDDSIAEEGDDAFMAELMKQMEGLSNNGEFENVLEGMMQQLMSKEMLYEPMKDLVEKYPVWLRDNKNDPDFEKYKQQHEYCQKIVAKYEDPAFDEKSESQGKEIMDLMTKMQDLGQPPKSLLDEMAPGMNFGNGEGMPDLKDLENCSIM